MSSLSLLLLAACAPHPAPIDRYAAESMGIAVVGASHDSWPYSEHVVTEIATAAQKGEIDLVVLVGDPVSQGSRKDWDAMRAMWQPVVDAGARLQPLVGSAAVRGDRHLANFAWSFPKTRSYGAGHMAWLRLVFADTSGDPDRHASELFWLPTAMGDGPTFLFVPDGPEAEAVTMAALDYAPASAPAIAVFSTADVADSEFPGGEFGEARVAVGPAADGWWRVQIAGTGLFLHLDGPPREHYRWDWTPDRGWTPEPPNEPTR